MKRQIFKTFIYSQEDSAKVETQEKSPLFAATQKHYSTKDRAEECADKQASFTFVVSFM